MNKTTPSHPSQKIQFIERFLTDVRRRTLWLELLQIFLSISIALLLFGGLMATWFFLQPPIFSMRPLVFVAIIASLSYLGFALFKVRQSLQDEPLSHTIENWNPRTYGLLTALELGRTLPSLQERPIFSSDLAYARITQVAKSIAPLRPVELIPTQQFKYRAFLFFILSSIFFVTFSLFPYHFSELFYKFIFPQGYTSLTLEQQKQGVLMIGDLNITYKFPSYIHRQPQTIPNSDGSLSALKGTKILLQGRTIFPINQAELLINNKQRVPLQVGNDHHTIKGQFTILKTGFYRFQLTDLKGHLQISSPHSIQIHKDRYPHVKLLSPRRDLELQERSKVKITYQFSDDFGISKISLVFKNLTKRQQKPTIQKIETFQFPPRGGTGTMIWDLSTTSFTPNDKISYQIEVLDNDIISGPKRTRSEIRYLTIYSPLHNHDKLLAQQERLLAKMVNFLGDIIEYPNIVVASSKGSLDQKYRGAFFKLNKNNKLLLASFRKLIRQLRKDTLTKPYTLITFENLQTRQQIRYFTRAQLESYLLTPHGQKAPFPRALFRRKLKKEIVPQEDDVYALSLLINRQQLDLIAHLSRQLSQSQNRLNDLLEQYRQHKNEKLKKKLLQEMRRIERLIRQIMKRMRKLNRQIPDEYLNMDAFKQKNSLRTIQKMRRHIKNDDIEKAASDLARLAQQVERMTSQMERYSKEAGGRGVRRLSSTMKKLINDIQQLAKREKKLAKYTQRIRHQIAKRMQKVLKKKLKSLLKKQMKRLKKIRQHTKKAYKLVKPFATRYRYQISFHEQKEFINEIQKLFKEPDVYEALKTVRRFLRKNFRLRFILHDHRRNTQFYLRFSSRRLRSHLRRRISRLKRSEKEIKKSNKIARKIVDDLSKFLPPPRAYMSKRDKQRLQRYRRIQQHLRRQGRRIRRRIRQINKKMPLFSPKMQRNLRSALQEMKNSARKLGRYQPKFAHNHQERAVSKLNALQKQLQQSMKPQNKGKNSKIGYQNRPKIKIPKAGQNKAPKALREDILKAMKEKVPRRYRKPVRRYYEKLVK